MSLTSKPKKQVVSMLSMVVVGSAKLGSGHVVIRDAHDSRLSHAWEALSEQGLTRMSQSLSL